MCAHAQPSMVTFHETDVATTTSRHHDITTLLPGILCSPHISLSTDFLSFSSAESIGWSASMVLSLTLIYKGYRIYVALWAGEPLHQHSMCPSLRHCDRR